MMTITSKNFLRKVLDSTLSGVYVYDLKLRRNVFINNQYTQLTGYRFKDLKAMSETQFFDLFHRDDMSRVEDHWEKITSGRENMLEIEYRFKTKDNRWIWCYSRNKVFACSHDGSVSQIIGAFLEFTKQKQVEDALRESESQFRQLADSMPQLVWTASPEGKVNYFNKRYKEYSGIEKRSDEICIWRPLLHEADKTRTIEKWYHAARTGEKYQIEHRIKLACGDYHWHLSRAVPVRDSKDNIIKKWFGTTTDINYIKKTEESLRNLTKHQEQVIAQRTRLAENRAKKLHSLAVELIETEEREKMRISELLHDDLQQMLAAALFHLQSVKENSRFQPILKNIERLIEESIAKSRSISHELSPPMLYQLDLFSVLESLTEQMDKQFDLKIDLSVSTERRFEIEPLKVFLFRAARELLFNVFKHAEIKNARVKLSGTQNCILLAVSDLGKGFNPDILGSGAIKNKLGLLSIQERARYLGGDLKINSTPGKGSRITLMLPIASADAGKHECFIPEVDKNFTASTVLKESGAEPIRVLFVDDHIIIRQGLIKLVTTQPDIEAAGEAANGREALKKAILLKPDLILMDVPMPEMDGIEAIRRVKEKLPEVHVIGLSMYEDDKIAASILEAGAETFLSKTVSSAELLKAIYKSVRTE